MKQEMQALGRVAISVMVSGGLGGALVACTPDHYLGYRALPRTDRAVSPQAATLIDQFGEEEVEILQPTRLYNPADKNDEGITRPDVHLVGYRLRTLTPHVPQTVDVTNQFGTLRLTTRRPDSLLVPSTKAIGDEPLFSISSGDDLLRSIDSTDGSTLTSVTITLGGATVEAGTGLARHPLTDELFALLKISGQNGRELVTLDPSTGVATPIGDTGHKFAGISFDSKGTLYGVVGDAGDFEEPNPETLFTLSTVDATPTLVTALGDGDDGEVIAFNPTDGLLYHGSGLGAPFFQTIDPSSLAIVNLRPSGFDYDELTALVFRNGSFLAVDLFGNDFLSITNRGRVTRLGSMDHRSKGLVGALRSNPNFPAGLLSISRDDNLLRFIDPRDGSTLDSLPIELAGVTVIGGTGLARHPLTGAFFALLRIEDALGEEQFGRELVSIDFFAGITRIGDTSHKFAGITFDSRGTLYGVVGDARNSEEPNPETLFTLSTVDATATLVTALGNGDDGEVIAFHPIDGLLYHGSGIGDLNVDQIFETVDPLTLAVANIPLSGFDPDELTALTFRTDRFLAADLSFQFLSITDDGLVTVLGAMDHQSKGLALFLSPEHVDHFKCYGVAHERFERGPVALLDQFRDGFREFTLQKPLELCTPVLKQVEGRAPEPIFNAQNHLLCYLLTPRADIDVDVSVNNQLGPEALRVFGEWELCVPSQKVVVD